MFVKVSISLYFRDCYDKILIKLEEIVINFCKYCYFSQFMFMGYLDSKIFLEGSGVSIREGALVRRNTICISFVACEMLSFLTVVKFCYLVMGPNRMQTAK